VKFRESRDALDTAAFFVFKFLIFNFFFEEAAG
jgi:hypothetical protein